MSERATREWRMSPTIATRSLEKSAPLCRRMVSMSSRPCVGCALRPSPALTKAVAGRAPAASAATAPLSAWRTTKQSTPIDSRVRMVSSAVSPLLVEDALTSKTSVSAPSRVAASWKELRVRVEGSKKSVQTVRPPRRLRSALPPAASAPKASAASSSARMFAAGRPSSVSRWRRRPSACSCETVGADIAFMRRNPVLGFREEAGCATVVR